MKNIATDPCCHSDPKQVADNRFDAILGILLLFLLTIIGSVFIIISSHLCRLASINSTISTLPFTTSITRTASISIHTSSTLPPHLPPSPLSPFLSPHHTITHTMADRPANAALSKENESLIAAGYYNSPTGARVDLRGFVTAATRGVVFYTPDDVTRVLTQQAQTTTAPRFTTSFEVTPETSTAAAARLHAAGRHPTVLNYASATKPGGGYLTGARAQEEDVCRSSALYTSLICAPGFYDYHKKNRDGRYSHRMIWTPDVVVYRHATTLALLPTPYLTSFITSAAPNAGAIAKNNPAALPQVSNILLERASRILAVAAAHNATNLVLGAWGCGVFRNSPAEVGAIFKNLLIGGPFDGRFDKVVFAVYDTSPAGHTIKAFEHAFPAGASANTVHLDPTGIRAAALARAANRAQYADRDSGHRRDADQQGGRDRDGNRNRDRDRGHGGGRGGGGGGSGGHLFTEGGRRLGDGSRSANSTSGSNGGSSTRDRSPARNGTSSSSSAQRAPSSTPNKPKPTKGPLDAWLIRKPAP
jgi:uncharacterized protein (TIGR02452 family)